MPAGGGDDRLDAHAALAGDELVVLLGQALAGAEERALDAGAAEAHAVADLAVGEALELAQDEDLVVGVGEAAERAAEVVELLLGVDRVVRGRLAGDEAAVVGLAEALAGVHRDLLGAAGAPELVDARVLGDLVDPRLEGDRAVGLAHAAQRGDEDVLRDVLGAAVVLDHAEDVGGDAALVARVELLEGAVVAAADGRDEARRRSDPPSPRGSRTPAHPGPSFPYPQFRPLADDELNDATSGKRVAIRTPTFN